MSATAYALGAIALWATLATLGVQLAHVPPFLLTGLALAVGSLIALPWSRFDLRRWRVPARTLALGVYGLFGFHALLFVALRTAPPVQANLVNYLWPLLIVVLAPLLLPGVRLRPGHVVAAAVGFAGAAIAILSAGTSGSPAFSLAWGYIPAIGSAFVWASYSLLSKRVAPFPTAAIGAFCLLSAVLSLLCHALFEPAVALGTRDWALIAVMGAGPLGAAFFLWDGALKRGDPRKLGVLSFVTPLASTVLLLLSRGQWPGPTVVLAGVMIVGAAVVAARA
ncbi:MAG: DMT family transporter [Betaproteobacteria bacterium]|nr:DMT family transporter [Betaproteobacteria bacterium]